MIAHRLLVLLTCLTIVIACGEDTRYQGNATSDTEADDVGVTADVTGSTSDAEASTDTGVTADTSLPAPPEEQRFTVSPTPLPDDALEFAMTMRPLGESSYVDIVALVGDEEHTALIMNARGPFEIIEREVVVRPEDNRWLYTAIVTLDADGEVLWWHTREARPTPDAAEAKAQGQSAATQGGLLLVSSVWTGALALVEGQPMEEATPESWRGAHLVFDLETGEQMGATTTELVTNAICQDSEPHAEGWIIACYDGSGLGYAMDIDRSLTTRRWSVDIDRVREDGWAYLFEATAPVRGHVVLQGLTSGGARLDGVVAVADNPEDWASYQFALEEGQIRWTGGVASRGVFAEPALDAFLSIAQPTGAEPPQRITLTGLGVDSGEPQWRVHYDAEGVTKNAYRSLKRIGADPARWMMLVDSGGNSVETVESMMFELSPVDGYRPQQGWSLPGWIATVSPGPPGSIRAVLLPQRESVVYFGELQGRSGDVIVAQLRWGG